MDRVTLEDLAALVIAVLSAVAAWAEQRPEYAGIGAILSILAKVIPSLLPKKQPAPPPPPEPKPSEPKPAPPRLTIDYVELQNFLRYFPPGSCRRFYIDDPLIPQDYPSYYYSKDSTITILLAISGGTPPYIIRSNLGSIAENTDKTIHRTSFPVDFDMLDGLTIWVLDSSVPQQKETYRLDAAIYGTGDIDPYAGCKKGKTGWCIDCVER